MNQRYDKVKNLEINEYNPKCPIEINKGALIADKVLNKMLLQLRVFSIAEIPISSIFIKIDCYDAAGDSIEGTNLLNHVFSDLHLKPKSTFANKLPVILDPLVRNIKIQIDKVVFFDGTIWRNDNQSIHKPNMIPIKVLGNDLLIQFKRELKETSLGYDDYYFIPEEHSTEWYCSCGRINYLDDNICIRCGVSKSWIFEHTNTEYLKRSLTDYQEQLMIIEEQKKRDIEMATKIQEQEALELQEREKQTAIAKRKRNIRSFKIGSGIALMMILGFSLYYFVIAPNNKYNSGILSIETGGYDDGIRILNELGDYKEVSTWIKEAEYRKALGLLEEKNYTDSLNIFSELLDYKNSAEMVFEVKYRDAYEKYENKKYPEAIELLSEIQNYQKAKDIIEEVKYNYSNKLLEDERYSDSLAILRDIGSYNNVQTELIPMINYKWFQNLLANKKFTEASQKLSIVDSTLYPNAQSEYLEAYKKYELELKDKSYIDAVKSASNGDFETAFKAMENLGDYKDSAKLASDYKKEAYKWVFTGGMNNSSYSRYDQFSFYGKLTGGPSNGKIDLQFTWKTPDWTFTDTSKGWMDGTYWEKGDGAYAYNLEPANASRGSGSVTIKVKSTGEILAKYTFTIN